MVLVLALVEANGKVALLVSIKSGLPLQSRNDLAAALIAPVISAKGYYGIVRTIAIQLLH